MPFQIKKVGEKYKLYRIKQKSFVNKEYNSKDAAIRAGKAMMRYRGEKPILKGNKLLHQKKKELTKSQKKMMEKHKEHHTAKHMKMMTKLMLEGDSFKKAHDKTMKKIGK
tara:strand:+ start:280 stop:609 length:330 start_codon:yes stop_codon:yes gene_type:complete